jgi:hypothetical protein
MSSEIKNKLFSSQLTTQYPHLSSFVEPSRAWAFMKVYVKSQSGKWLMPTNPANARILLKKGKGQGDSTDAVCHSPAL